MGKLSGVKVIDMVAGKIEKVAYAESEYVRVEGSAKVGDLTLITDGTWCDATEGEFYLSVDLSASNPVIIDDIGDRDSNYDDGCYVLFRKVAAPSSDLEVDTALVTRVEALESDMAALKGGKEAEEAPKFKAGDKVRSINWGQVYTLVSRKPDYDTDDKIAWNTNPGSWSFENEVELVEDEPEFAVGDYAKVVGPTEFGDINEGTIVEITDIIDHDHDNIRFVSTNGEADWSSEASLEKVSAEEASAKAKWAKIGREVDEYKKGDIVAVANDKGAAKLTPGTIAIVSRVNSDGDVFLKFEKDGDEKHFYLRYNVELVTPAESRFDR